MKSQNGSGREEYPILVLNGGSSSIKCALIDRAKEKAIWKGKISWKENLQEAVFEKNGSHKKLYLSTIKEGFETLLKEFAKEDFQAIGHRVVHGGPYFSSPTFLNKEVLEKIASISEFAPLHNDVNIEGIKASSFFFPHHPQFAVFDTAFHHTLPENAYTYPLPLELREKGIRRFGFHGISYSYCLRRLKTIVQSDLSSLRILLCHLGSGCSLCAVKAGKSVETTMGLTPLEGMMMATRSGSIDPSILTLLFEQKKEIQEIKTLLNERSGLFGVSGFSSDMRDIEVNLEKNPRAKLAKEMFIYSLQKHMGMMLASMQGVDMIIFTGGIGENFPELREEALKAFSFLPIMIDKKKNRSSSQEERKISTEDSSVQVFVIPAFEEYEIAKQYPY